MSSRVFIFVCYSLLVKKGTDSRTDPMMADMLQTNEHQTCV